MKKLILIVLVTITNIVNAGTVNLYHGTTPSTQSNFTVCNSQTDSFYITYTFSSHSSCWANRYKVTFKLFKDGIEINNSYLTVSTTFANNGFYNFTVTPGTYTAQVILERRPCAGAWYRAETLNSNAIVVSSPVTIDFSIKGVLATATNHPTVNFVNGEIITIDASNTACESNYWVGVWETGTLAWERTFAYEWGQWFTGNAPANINLQQLATNSPNYSLYNGDVARKGQILFGGFINSVFPGPDTTALQPYQAGLVGQARYYTVEVCTATPSWSCKKI